MRLEKHQGLVRVIPDGGRRFSSARLVDMTQQQYPGQFSQSSRPGGDAGATDIDIETTLKGIWAAVVGRVLVHWGGSPLLIA